jgi:hypothetical protein
VRIYYVWIDMLASDDRYSAYLRALEFDDPRASYYWDKHKLTGIEWKETIGLEEGVAWDMYFVYGPDATWSSVPTVPDFWTHQLAIPEDIAPRLSLERLTREMLSIRVVSE